MNVEEPGCLGDITRSGRCSVARLFYIHSRWKDEAAFENHAVCPAYVRFVECVQPLIDHPLEVTGPSIIG